MKNEEILNINQNFQNENFDNINFPVKTIFYIEKNKNIFKDLAEEILETRYKIVKEESILDEKTNNYICPKDKIDKVNSQIAELLNIEQEIDIKKVKLDDLQDLKLTAPQMETLMFMIEE